MAEVVKVPTPICHAVSPPPPRLAVPSAERGGGVTKLFLSWINKLLLHPPHGAGQRITCTYRTPITTGNPAVNPLIRTPNAPPSSFPRCSSPPCLTRRQQQQPASQCTRVFWCCDDVRFCVLRGKWWEIVHPQFHIRQTKELSSSPSGTLLPHQIQRGWGREREITNPVIYPSVTYWTVLP